MNMRAKIKKRISIKSKTNGKIKEDKINIKIEIMKDMMMMKTLYMQTVFLTIIIKIIKIRIKIIQENKSEIGNM